MANVSIRALSDELINAIKAIPALSEKTFSVFNIDDMKEVGEGIRPPYVGVGYYGATSGSRDAAVKDVKTPVVRSRTAQTITFQFVIVVAVDYNVLADSSRYLMATDILDELRVKILGLSGVTYRGWTLVSENPMDAGEEGGVLYYQLWETKAISVGDIGS